MGANKLYNLMIEQKIRKHIANHLLDIQAGISLYASLKPNPQKLLEFQSGRSLRELKSKDFWEGILRKLSFQSNNVQPAKLSVKPKPKLVEPDTDEALSVEQSSDPPEVEDDRIRMGTLSNQMKKVQRELGDLVQAEGGKENTPENIANRKELVKKILAFESEINELKKRVSYWESNGEYPTASPESEDRLETEKKLKNLASQISKTKKSVAELEKELKISPGHSKTQEKLDKYRAKLNKLLGEQMNLKLKMEALNA